MVTLLCFQSFKFKIVQIFRVQNKTQNKIQNKSHTERINPISSEKSNTQVRNKKSKSKERANQYDPNCDPNNVAFYKTQATAEK